MKKVFSFVLLIMVTIVLTGCGTYQGNYDYFEVDAESYGIATGYAIAFPKGSQLVEPTNTVLAELEEDGTLACLNDFWLGGQVATCYNDINFTSKIYGVNHNGNGSSLTILTSSGYEPFEMADANGNLTGFDIDLAKLIFKELNYNLVWEDVEFDKIVGDITNNQAQVAIAAITPTDERKENVAFSNDYFTESYTVALYRENEEYTSIDDLEDKVVSAQSGTVQAQLIEMLYEQGKVKKVVLLSYPATAMQSLKTNKIDVFFVEQSIAVELLEEFNK